MGIGYHFDFGGARSSLDFVEFIENAIRPFALGRKNWMFSDTEAGAESGAAIYTVLLLRAN
jgi:Transposase IS66 family